MILTPRITPNPLGNGWWCCGRKHIDAGRYGYGMSPRAAYTDWVNSQPWVARVYLTLKNWGKYD